ncbi:MAG: phage tail protein, partial [Clostridiales bacterium]|nr:phage tail protein [Clostridiales bacterium]
MAEVKKGRQTPTQAVTLPYEVTHGAEAVVLYNETGRTAQQWQELLLYDILAENDDGLWVHTKFGYSVPRRNGKNEIAAMRELWGLRQGENILHTAHRTTTSHAAWERLCNLLTKAQNYLAQVTSAVASFEVSAVDLALVSAEYDYINLGDYVLIQSDPHGINQYVELTAMKIDLLDPANDTLTFGADTASLTDSQRSSDRSVQAALETVSTRITNLVATVITTEYLSANYATITELDSVTARIDSITSTTITTEYLEANYATINSLTAATANITDLTAEVANINSVLAGNVGAGTVETVHLTADNVVIDDAVITDAMIVNLT